MELKQIWAKKSLKLLLLLLSSLLIGTVSATVYSHMYIQGSGTILGGLNWQKGTLFPAGASIVGGTVENLDLSVRENASVTYTDCLRLVNDDNSTHTFGLAAAVTGGSFANFTTFNLNVSTGSDGSGQIASISINGGSASSLSITAGEILYVSFELVPLESANMGTVSFTITLTY
jgi:hypothetical protein